ncbi:hypothetical protein [Flavobacterium ginsenosidimutans]|uniref:Uncharacterized protein n=1 Tax=Flavobacterium ginsenosidimutans TaxID=687844 RepID=A0ABZ2QCZ7_9FLAO
MDFKSQYEAYENSKRVTQIADNETSERLKIPVGSEYTIFPPPSTKQEAFERLKMYTGIIHLDSYVKAFRQRFPINLRTLSDELKTLDAFIVEAEELSTVDAFTNKSGSSVKRNHYEYLKWKYGYYENLEFNDYDFFSADAEFVYGKYFLYKKWLQEQIGVLTPKKQVNIVDRHKEDLKYHEKINPKKNITVFERIKRELNTIHWVIISQSLTKKNDVDNIINEDGRFCRIINLRSDRELISLEEYKQHYTERFENANTNVLVKNELIEIYRTALVIKKMYDETLTYSNPLVKDLFDSYQDNPKLLSEDIAFRTMIVLVVDYRVQNILFGYDSNSNDQNTVFTVRNFNYQVFNDELIGYCYSLINFINTFEIPELSYKGNEETIWLKDDLEVNVINVLQQPITNLDLSEQERKIIEAIEDHLPEGYFTGNSYEIIKSNLLEYFLNNSFPKFISKINTIRINKKKIGWGLSCLFKELKSKPLSIDYILFAKNIDKFENEIVENGNFQKSNLYKYMTERPRK